ncbi:hypothetical protein ACERIT_15045 [Halopenitus sp. H-Gu1]
MTPHTPDAGRAGDRSSRLDEWAALVGERVPDERVADEADGDR